MLRTVQYIALVQGIFLLVVLLKNRARYKKPAFGLFIGCLLSVMGFLIADDDLNMWGEDPDLFLFDSSLFVTFLFLFFKYRISGDNQFKFRDLWFFLPYLIYVVVESSELLGVPENAVLEILEMSAGLAFLGYLIYIPVMAFRQHRTNRTAYFILPLLIVAMLNYSAEVRELFTGKELVILGYEDYNSYFLLLLALLFFATSFVLIDQPGKLLARIKNGGYQNSVLKPEQISRYKNRLIEAMAVDQIFLNPRLSIHDVSEKLEIPRRYISQVLNVHMQLSFQEFVNQYRVAAFIKSLKESNNNHLTLYGLASEAGFNSKTTFNSAFKKATGMTPLAFKNSLEAPVKAGSE